MKKTIRTIDPSKLSPSMMALNPHLCDPFKPLETEKLAAEVKGKRRKQMNKTEAEFSRILQARLQRGEIEDFDYESTTLRWGELDNIQYTPDFTVVESTSLDTDREPERYVKLVFIEAKGGHIWPKDMQKFKAARNQWPLYRFELWQKKKGEWRQLL